MGTLRTSLVAEPQRPGSADGARDRSGAFGIDAASLSRDRAARRGPLSTSPASAPVRRGQSTLINALVGQAVRVSDLVGLMA